MGTTLLWVGGTALYLLPVVIVVLRRPKMGLFIATLDIVLGWTIIGWAMALLFSIAFPRPGQAPAARGAASVPVAVPPGASAQASVDFVRDPLTVGVLTFVAPVGYAYWWLWRFFKLAEQQRFPRARSFWWIFVPLYGYVVIFRILEDLESRLQPEMRRGFSARMITALIVAANAWSAFAAIAGEPLAIGFVFLGLAFLAAATSMTQRAANGYLLAGHPKGQAQSFSLGEVAAVVIGITVLGLNVLGATRVLTVRSGASAVASPTPLATPSRTAVPSASPFPASGDGFTVTSEPGDFIGEGAAITFSRQEAYFAVEPGALASRDISIDVRPGQLTWVIEFAPAPGQSLHVGSYPNAVRPVGARAGHPGLSVSSPGRGCNEVSGTFEITAISFDADGQLVLLDATFVQHCERAAAPALRGRIRYVSPNG